jgi:hypothetical protein
VAEQPIEVLDAAGEAVRLRRIRVRLKTPTREGESEIYLLRYRSMTNLPAGVEALTVAGLYRKRWTLEIVFTQMTKTDVLALRAERDHIPDFHFTVGDHHSINEQLYQGTLLLEGGAC